MLTPNRHLGSWCNVRLSAAWPAPHAGLHWAAVTARQGFYAPLASIPSGYAAPQNGSVPAIRAGSLSTYRAPVLTLTPTAVGALGRNLDAAAAIQILAEATGGLIAGGTAAATITLIGSAEVVAALKGEAAGTITITALADASALGFSAAAAVVTVSGSGQPMGKGFMVATTAESGLTPAGIARAVWEALAAGNNAAGTMGEKLNLAGSGGVDVNALAAAVWAAVSAANNTPGTMGAAAQATSGVATGSTFNHPATGFTLTTGAVTAGAYTVTAPRDGVLHTISGVTGPVQIDGYYSFQLALGDLPTSVFAYAAYQQNAHACRLYAYNFQTSAWQQIGQLIGTSQAVFKETALPIYSDHISPTGEVRVRFASADTGCILSIDQLFVSYGASRIDANIVQVRGQDLSGTGIAADPWGPA